MYGALKWKIGDVSYVNTHILYTIHTYNLYAKHKKCMLQHKCGDKY